MLTDCQVRTANLQSSKPSQENIAMNDRRQHYRKRVRTVGYVVSETGTLEFCIQDVSLDGLRAYFKGDPLLEPGSLVHIRLPSLNLEGPATLTRLAPADKGRYAAGFHFDASALHPLRPLAP
jgi:hypothetical protein